MKNLIKIFAAAGLAFTLSSCGAANDVYGNGNPNSYPGSYPTNNGTVYRTPEGTVYRQGEVYRDRNGNVYQNGRVIQTGDVYGQPGVIARGGNNTVYYPNNNARNLPPGQAKKIYGGRAKDYAPGQVKKRNGNWNDNRGGHNGEWRKDDDRKYPKYSYKKDKNNKKYKNGKHHDNDD